jgi:type II secretory ATPase GspE/PulE/Tfp pilus assembly ATPase PilB-like protein
MGTKDSLVGRLLGNAEKFSDKQVAETLTMLIEHGAKRGASDIHIEPHERFVLVRYRIDGTLRGVHKLPRQALGSIMAQLKTLAGLNVQESHAPQEGSYHAAADKTQVEIRVTTMPVYGGEKAVLHLSEERGDPIDLADLGFWGDGLQTLKTVLSSPHGLIVVAGPRHSGVSSTLFSLLRDLNSPLLSVATVETDTGHRLRGVSQTYLRGGMSMQEGLQAALKQDPNILMVDNLPDGPTSELAVQAATTGHLVLVGLHADSSIAAVLRLRHAGVEPFLLVTALRVGVGQRLVRRLCAECRVRYALEEEDRKQLEESLGMLTVAARKRVHELEQSAAPAIFGDVKQLNSSAAGITHLWRASETGCEACDHSGYNGRIAIVEVLKNNDALHKAIMSKDMQSAAAIQTALLKDGFIPMALDGLVKALRGQTTVAEVLRAMSLG